MNPAAQLIAPQHSTHGRWPFASSSTWSLSLATSGDHGQKGLLRELYVTDSLHAFLALLLLLQQFFLPGYVSSSHHFAALHLRCESATAIAQYTQSQTHGQAGAFARAETRGSMETYRRKTENSDRWQARIQRAPETARQVLIPSDTNIFDEVSYFNTHTHIPTTHPLTNTFLRTALMVSRATTLLPTHA
jgi:hypothetical protein